MNECVCFKKILFIVLGVSRIWFDLACGFSGKVEFDF